MRKEALIGLSILLVAVSGSATVLDSFGVMSGKSSVGGPTFWVGESSDLYFEKQSSYRSGTATGDTFTYDFDNAREWYNMKVDMYAKVAEDSDGSDDSVVDVKLKFEAFDNSDSSIDSCDVVKEDIEAKEPDSGIDNTVSANCNLNLGQNKIGKFEYMIEANSTDNELNLQRYGDTRAEVNAQ